MMLYTSGKYIMQLPCCTMISVTEDWLCRAKSNYVVGNCPNCKTPIMVASIPFHLSGRFSPFIVKFEYFSVEYAKKLDIYVDFRKPTEEEINRYLNPFKGTK